MKHPDLAVKNITIKDSPSFKVRVESWESVAPKGLMAVDIIQECLDDKGQISSSSTYNFHMNREEIKLLCEGLLSV
jgi:hypothetical protein